MLLIVATWSDQESLSLHLTWKIGRLGEEMEAVLVTQSVFLFNLL